jgi:hypothetical protein
VTVAAEPEAASSSALAPSKWDAMFASGSGKIEGALQFKKDTETFGDVFNFAGELPEVICLYLSLYELQCRGTRLRAGKVNMLAFDRRIWRALFHLTLVALTVGRINDGLHAPHYCVTHIVC